MMSRCFTWVPYWWISRTKYIPEFGGFYNNVGKVVDESPEIDGTCPTCVVEKVWE